MGLVVLKYGGSSVADPARIQSVAQRVAARHAAGDEIVVVVSAMGNTTDELLALGRTVNEQASDRELDLLASTGEIVSCALVAMALQATGLQARAFTGAQAGILTDDRYTSAAITGLDLGRLHASLAAGEIPVVAGFQGVADDGQDRSSAEVTTLGRGGSDTTAVALAVGLGAARCEIYTDVDGVFTADPRVIPRARRLPCISAAETLEMARHGAQVLHARAVELASVHALPMLVRSSFGDGPGTWIVPPRAEAPVRPYAPAHDREAHLAEGRTSVVSIAHTTAVAKLTVYGLPDPDVAIAQTFVPLARAGIDANPITLYAHRDDGLADCSFVVADPQCSRAFDITLRLARDLDAESVRCERSLGTVSLIGLGLRHAPDAAVRACSSLEAANISIEQLCTSQDRLTYLVPQEHVIRAVQVLHSAFELDGDSEEPGATRYSPVPWHAASPDRGVSIREEEASCR